MLFGEKGKVGGKSFKCAEDLRCSSHFSVFVQLQKNQFYLSNIFGNARFDLVFAFVPKNG